MKETLFEWIRELGSILNEPNGGKVMQDLQKQIAHLLGLMEGMGEIGGPQGKVLAEMAKVLESIGDAIAELKENQEEIESYLASIDEDLYDLEEEIRGEEEDDDTDDDLIETDCPECGETVCFEADALGDDDVVEVTCPNCGAVVFTTETVEEDKPEETPSLKQGEDI